MYVFVFFLLVFVFKLLKRLRTTVLTFGNISGVLHFPVYSSLHLFIINRYLYRLYKLILKAKSTTIRSFACKSDSRLKIGLNHKVREVLRLFTL